MIDAGEQVLNYILNVDMINTLITLFDSQELNSGEGEALEFYNREIPPIPGMTVKSAASSESSKNGAKVASDDEILLACLIDAVNVMPIPVIPTGSPGLKWPLCADLAFLLALTFLESSCRLNARSSESSAKGAFQMTDGFLQFMDDKFKGCVRALTQTALRKAPSYLSSAPRAAGSLRQAVIACVYFRSLLKYDSSGKAVGMRDDVVLGEKDMSRGAKLVLTPSYSEIFDGDVDLRMLDMRHRCTYVYAIIMDHLYHFGSSNRRELSVSRSRVMVKVMIQVFELLEGKSASFDILPRGIAALLSRTKDDIWSKLTMRYHYQWMFEVARYPVTSLFGTRRHPISGAVVKHNGIDVACPAGTRIGPIFGVSSVVTGKDDRSGIWVRAKLAPEVVISSNHTGSVPADQRWGQTLGIWPYCCIHPTNDGREPVFELVFAHLSTNADFQKDLMSLYITSGNTGQSTGPHLHLGVKLGGTFVDPRRYIWIGSDFKGGTMSLSEWEQRLEDLLRIAL